MIFESLGVVIDWAFPRFLLLRRLGGVAGSCGMASNLPIVSIRDELKENCGQFRNLVLRAPTGSGKSTQVPQMLLDEELIPEGKEIVVLQPWRIAARMLAKRVAEERRGELGAEVGYQIRFELVFGAKTRIRFVTEGILLRRMLADPELKSSFIRERERRRAPARWRVLGQPVAAGRRRGPGACVEAGPSARVCRRSH